MSKKLPHLIDAGYNRIHTNTTLYLCPKDNKLSKFLCGVYCKCNYGRKENCNKNFKIQEIKWNKPLKKL